MSMSKLAFTVDSFASYCINKGRKDQKSEWQIAWELWRDATLAASAAPTEERRTVAPNVDGQDFYELCQAYRWSKEIAPLTSVPNTVQAFNNLRDYIKTGKLPWLSYELPNNGGAQVSVPAGVQAAAGVSDDAGSTGGCIAPSPLEARTPEKP